MDYVPYCLIASLAIALAYCLVWFQQRVKEEASRLQATLMDEMARVERSVAEKVERLVTITDGCKAMTEHAIHIAVSAEHHADEAALGAYRMARRAEEAAERYAACAQEVLAEAGARAILAPAASEAAQPGDNHDARGLRSPAVRR